MAQHLDGQWVVSPQEIVAEFEGKHKVALEAAARSGALDFTPEPDPAMALLRDRGIEYEKEQLNALESSLRVKRLGSTAHSVSAYEAAWQATAQSMDEEYDIIYQAALFTGDFIGIADFPVAERDVSGALRVGSASTMVCRMGSDITPHHPPHMRSSAACKFGSTVSEATAQPLRTARANANPTGASCCSLNDSENSSNQVDSRNLASSATVR